MDNRLYWLWLQKSLGYAAKIRELISYYGDAKNLFESGEASWRESGLFGGDLFGIKSTKIEEMKRTSLEDGQAVINLCEKNGIDIITPDSDLYPEKLKLISDFPAVLFCKGDLSCLKGKLPIAVIGTRHPSQYGIGAAQAIADGLAKESAVIISGGALGIDSIAHNCAISQNSKTVLVLGCGHLSDYLRENEALRTEVSKNGAVISEYSPMESAQIHYFPKRNRIISGISNDVVIIEAGVKSGTLNTARHAKEQGREVFAVPGDVSSVAYAGSNKLIREGAKAIFSAEDILGYYSYSINAIREIENAEALLPFGGIEEFPFGKAEKKNRKKTTETKAEKAKNEEENLSEPEKDGNFEKIFTNFIAESVSDSANIVYNHMSGEETTLDEITRKCGMPAHKVLTALTELEMENIIVSCGPGRYRRV